MLPTNVLLIALVWSFSSARVRTDAFDTYNTNYWDNWADNLVRKIDKQVRQDLSGLNQYTSNSRPHINLPSRRNFAGLDNLGSTISQQVYDGLRPVRELQTKLKIKNGDGGATVATFKDKQVIIHNGVVYKCDGTISGTGTCSGTIRKPSFTNKRDFCYLNINIEINHWYCISNGGGVESGTINGKPLCNSYNNNPTLLISKDDYRNLCGDGAYPVTYKYFGTQPVGEHSSDVQCSDGTPYTCTYTEYRNPNVISVGSVYQYN